MGERPERHEEMIQKAVAVIQGREDESLTGIGTMEIQERSTDLRGYNEEA